MRYRLEIKEEARRQLSAMERNAGEPGVPWDQVKAELDLD